MSSHRGGPMAEEERRRRRRRRQQRQLDHPAASTRHHRRQSRSCVQLARLRSSSFIYLSPKYDVIHAAHSNAVAQQLAQLSLRHLLRLRGQGLHTHEHPHHPEQQQQQQAAAAASSKQQQQQAAAASSSSRRRGARLRGPRARSTPPSASVDASSTGTGSDSQ